MKFIKAWYTAIFIVVLMLLRIFVSGAWFASIEIAGFLVAWIDFLNRFLKKCHPHTVLEKHRFSIIFIIIAVIGILLLILGVWNLITEIAWLSCPLLLDEISLVALLMSLSQSNIIYILKNIMTKDK